MSGRDSDTSSAPTSPLLKTSFPINYQTSIRSPSEVHSESSPDANSDFAVFDDSHSTDGYRPHRAGTHLKEELNALLVTPKRIKQKGVKFSPSLPGRSSKHEHVLLSPGLRDTSRALPASWLIKRGLLLSAVLGGFFFFYYALFLQPGVGTTISTPDSSSSPSSGYLPFRDKEASSLPSASTEKVPTDPLDRVRHWNKNRPMKRFAIVMVAAGESYGGLYNASVHSHKTYADIHNYYLFVDRESFVEVDNPEKESGMFRMYQKLVTLYKYILKGLEEKTYDWILWNDSDMFITNPAVHLESFVPKGDDERRLPNILAAWDWNGLNAGSMFIRVDYWSLSFFARALAYRYYGTKPVNTFQDQQSITNLIEEHQDVKERFFRTPVPHWFNAYPDGGDDILWRKEDFLIHLPGGYKDRWRDQLAISDAAVSNLVRTWDEQESESYWSEYDLALQAAVQRWWATSPKGVP